jgi:hypothetical protein
LTDIVEIPGVMRKGRIGDQRSFRLAVHQSSNTMPMQMISSCHLSIPIGDSVSGDSDDISPIFPVALEANILLCQSILHLIHHKYCYCLSVPTAKLRFAGSPSEPQVGAADSLRTYLYDYER